MKLHYYKPITPSLRQKIIISKNNLSKITTVSKLHLGNSETGGRNNSGKITAYKRGGGHKKSYTIIDFTRAFLNVSAIVKDIQYDSMRSSFIALLCYSTGILSYILAPATLKIGDKVINGEKFEIQIGNSLPLKNVPVGTFVHNLEISLGKGGQLARSAGTYAQLLSKDILAGYAMLKIASGQVHLLSSHCFVTIGKVSNINNKHINLGKAGVSRWLGRRPTVRGVAMNPIDHPHGGGEGKTSGGRVSVTPWGLLTKGRPTRNRNKKNFFILNLK